MPIKLIIGLRNPGATYEHTRHNAGVWLIRALSQLNKSSFKVDKKMQAELAEFSSDSYQCTLALPLNFMNHSGLSARAICHFYKILPEELLIVHDELDLPVGRLKLKIGGGHGGHNGLRDIINQLGSAQFYRLRIGIGHPGHKELVHQYVLTKPSVHDKQQIYHAIDRAITALPCLLTGDVTRAMNQINT